jgi:3-oxoacyl-[acyl-carrier protein] reductase
MNQSIPRRIAIVTGVSRLQGIGKAICVELAKQDVDVFFTYWLTYDRQMPWPTAANEPELIQQAIRNLGVNCEKIELDLAPPAAIDRLFDAVTTQLGPPSILVNNATYSTQTSLQTITGPELDQHYWINLRATTLLCVEFAKRFSASANRASSSPASQGRIINLSSGQSLSAMSGEIAYAITKGAIETLTRTICHELAAQGITINAVNPGLTDSGWMDAATRASFLPRSPMGRFGQPEDAARLIAFLASDAAGWITGQVIHSEGGFVREKYD